MWLLRKKGEGKGKSWWGSGAAMSLMVEGDLGTMPVLWTTCVIIVPIPPMGKQRLEVPQGVSGRAQTLAEV